jgi:hypothetical protein
MLLITFAELAGHVGKILGGLGRFPMPAASGGFWFQTAPACWCSVAGPSTCRPRVRRQRAGEHCIGDLLKSAWPIQLQQGALLANCGTNDIHARCIWCLPQRWHQDGFL